MFTISWGWMLPAVLLVVSCGSYNTKIQRYYTQMDAGRYAAAYRTLDHIKFLKRPRNRFLYYAEKGRMAHLMGLYDSSNRLMNRADQIAEVRYSSLGDKVAGTLLNPMMQTYHGEPFERLMLNYYKALNYCALGDTESALVEARRISIATNDQMDARKEKDNRYSRDAFSLNLQGMIYEMGGDINNAFIAYRNAAETYMSHPDKTWYGVPIPAQLQKDLLRTAYLNGFTGELQRFEELFNTKYNHVETPEGGELVVFLENGVAPIKDQENLVFTMMKGVGGNFHFTDAGGSFFIPFDVNRYNTRNADLSQLRTFYVALPRYEVVSSSAKPGAVQVNGNAYVAETAEDINTIAVESMRENRVKDITAALTRLFVKKLAEAGARAAVKSVANSSDDNDSEEEKRKKERKAEAAATAAGIIFQVFSAASEKADTRNWQSLPAYIHYVRVPLKKGPNEVVVDSEHDERPQTITVEGSGGLRLMNLR